MKAAVFRSPRQKAMRIVEDEIAWADEHHMKVRFDGRGYRAVCSCAWIGEMRGSRSAADEDATAHRAA